MGGGGDSQGPSPATLPPCDPDWIIVCQVCKGKSILSLALNAQPLPQSLNVGTVTAMPVHRAGVSWPGGTRTRGNGLTLQQGRCRLDIRNDRLDMESLQEGFSSTGTGCPGQWWDLKDVRMRPLGTWVSGGFGSAGEWLDLMILEGFSNRNGSVI